MNDEVLEQYLESCTEDHATIPLDILEYRQLVSLRVAECWLQEATERLKVAVLDMEAAQEAGDSVLAASRLAEAEKQRHRMHISSSLAEELQRRIASIREVRGGPIANTYEDLVLYMTPPKPEPPPMLGWTPKRTKNRKSRE